ncbi:hypothetical protein DFP72DRAFT_545483 [Ephemerocybe angulata]|uniref:Uncharacterized protein n=1 Tax=Ephemerocybe angulata TaxID=980116 RepID=A0A8H6HMG1_9AGAR|nr:hypothetical protein DFP72DRAFT_545483 [Tulosesus angulatus]
MEQCMQISEIVALICSVATKGSALSIGLTSRQFLEPALDSVWQTIDSFEPLIKCLPTDIWARRMVPSPNPGITNTIVTLRRELRPDDLRRYLTFYAPRIRSFGLKIFAGMHILSIESLLALQVATDYQLGALAPRLKKLAWCADDVLGRDFSSQLPAFMSLFLSSEISWIKFDSDIGHYPLDAALMRRAFKHLPHLKALTGTEFGRLPTSIFTSFSWSHLERLSLHEMSEDDLRHAMTLPSLRKLAAINSRTIPVSDRSKALARRISTAFPSLREVVFVTFHDDITSLIGIMQNLPASSLIECLISSGASASHPPVSECKALFQAIRDKCSPLAMKKLRLIDGLPCGRDALRHGGTSDSNDNNPRTTQHEAVDISLLYSLKRLENVKLGFPGGVLPNPDVLSRIAVHWPNLRELDILSTCFHANPLTPPCVDHNHVTALLQALPSLRTLCLQFDSTGLVGDEPVPKSASKLQVFIVGDSPITSPSKVARFITTQCPLLQKLDILQYKTTPLLTPFGERWQVVSALWGKEKASRD